MRTILGLLALAALTAAPGVTAQTAFHDDFEGTTLDPFWTPYSNAGAVIFPSDAQVHGGNQSLRLETYATSGPSKAAGVFHPFAQPAYGVLSVWLYDTGADVASSNYLTLWANPFGIGTYDYDLGPQSGGTYQYVVGAASGATSIDRTQGWHHFVITSLPGSASIEVDGTTVYTNTTGGMPFAEVQLEMHAPGWRPDWVSHWDDFSYEPAAWTDLGFALPGTLGAPVLEGAGTLLLGSAGALTLTHAGPSAPALLFVSLQSAPTPFKGGTLVPLPPLLALPLVTLPFGSTTIAWSAWPAGLPSGASLYLQYAILDAGAVQGVALSNALHAIVP